MQVSSQPQLIYYLDYVIMSKQICAPPRSVFVSNFGAKREVFTVRGQEVSAWLTGSQVSAAAFLFLKISSQTRVWRQICDVLNLAKFCKSHFCILP